MNLLNNCSMTDLHICSSIKLCSCLWVSMSAGSRVYGQDGLKHQQLSLWGSYGNHPQSVAMTSWSWAKQADPHKSEQLCESRSDTNCSTGQTNKEVKSFFLFCSIAALVWKVCRCLQSHDRKKKKTQFPGQGGTVGTYTSPSVISKDGGTVGVDWFDVLMHCLMTGSSKSRMPLWCLSIGGHEKRHLAPELRVTAASGFKGSCRAGRWLHWCHIIHSAWPLFSIFFPFSVSSTSPSSCLVKTIAHIKVLMSCVAL